MWEMIGSHPQNHPQCLSLCHRATKRLPNKTTASLSVRAATLAFTSVGHHITCGPPSNGSVTGHKNEDLFESWVALSHHATTAVCVGVPIWHDAMGPLIVDGQCALWCLSGLTAAACQRDHLLDTTALCRINAHSLRSRTRLWH